MIVALDHTHDPARRSWVSSANNGMTDFPIQNLPLCVFSTGADDGRCGVAIGDRILDLRQAANRGLIRTPAVEAASEANLDALFALGRTRMRKLRHDVFALLGEETGVPDESLLYRVEDCRLHLPTSIRSFTDFFVGVHHAVRCAEITGQTDNPLPPNFHHMPLGYNGRASTVCVSGEEVRRPLGFRKRIGEAEVSYGASRWLDFELEIGFFIGAGNRIGDPVAIADAGDQVVGFCLLNDWSARDIQLFEMAPLGAFNSKSFSTGISPWVVTADALEPFRTSAMERFAGSPPLADYLHDPSDQRLGGIDVALFATISTEHSRARGEPPAHLLRTNARYMYWTAAQMAVQQSVGGCSLVPGDLIGTGTLSGPSQAEYASLFELSAGGQAPIAISGDECRAFLEDGDEISFSGRCERVGFAPIGFGSCTGRITAAPTMSDH